VKVPVKSEGNNAYFKVMLEKEVGRYNELKEVLIGVTERVKNLCQEINSEFSIFQSSASMENIVKMLESASMSESRNAKSISISGSEDR
jgi:hypothetical protein